MQYIYAGLHWNNMFFLNTNEVELKECLKFVSCTLYSGPCLGRHLGHATCDFYWNYKDGFLSAKHNSRCPQGKINKTDLVRKHPETETAP